MKTLTWQEVQNLKFALDELVGYVADNSCGDPDCCGGPFFEQDDFDRAEATLAENGLKWNGKTE